MTILSPYRGYIDHDGKTGRQWLSEFRSDLSSALNALEAWQQTAYAISCDARDCNAFPKNHLEIPSEFRNLTRILALWSDVELRIDPSPLVEFLRRLHNFAPGKHHALPSNVFSLRTPMTDEEIEQVLSKAGDAFDRIYHATLAIGDEKQADEWQASQSAYDPRDEWIYEQCNSLIRYERIVQKLRKLATERDWERISSIQGIKFAANRYADRHQLPRIPPRQQGRKPGKSRP
jgi:hypothetical protein